MNKIIKKTSFYILFSCFFFCVFLPDKIKAAVGTDQASAKSITLSEFLRFFYLYLSRITLLLSFLMIVLAIYSYMTSSGNPKKIEKSKEYITNAIIAIVAVALAFTFFEVINPGILNIQ
uniref:Uncharacterized protein n=1 Tax=candidate division CPR3 bacterium TaxID=2268181 RepID=A0A7C4R2A4_UNCC3